MVSIGPGSFTRITDWYGDSVKAMAYALQIPLYGVMTMDSLARNVVYTNRDLYRYRCSEEDVFMRVSTNMMIMNWFVKRNLLSLLLMIY
ncbi:MAG: hypothetical protein ACLUPK_08400 [Veillonella sp.]